VKLYAGEKTGRRRRSWYRRRLRIQRGMIGVMLAGLLALTGWRTATHLLAYRSRRARRTEANSSWTSGNIHSKLPALASSAATPVRLREAANGIYPYSVIPGGVRGADDLERAAAHDRLVWEHYARFQFQHARLVRATEAREVYLSYRLRNHIYWTRKRMHLHPGELLLTDGKITARTRCGNQVSDQPKPDVSEEEPSEDVLDRPVAQLEPAMPIRSALARPSLPGVDPMAPPGPQAFGGGGFLFPYVPFGVPLAPVCETAAQEAQEKSLGISDNEGNEKHCLPKRNKPPVVPEPSTMLLISSGLAAVYWQYRRTSLARASSR
jgi:PEP-CTERM motif-containing protein